MIAIKKALRPAKQALNELNAAFAKALCEAASGVLILPETENQPFMPDQESLFMEIRKHFIQALGEMKVLSYERLKRVFFPVTVQTTKQQTTQTPDRQTLQTEEQQTTQASDKTDVPPVVQQPTYSIDFNGLRLTTESVSLTIKSIIKMI